jgi:hypothetical protein
LGVLPINGEFPPATGQGLISTAADGIVVYFFFQLHSQTVVYSFHPALLSPLQVCSSILFFPR